MDDDERGRTLPPWREYRQRYVDEDETTYRLLKLEFEVRQGRDRDHWLVSQFNAVLGNVELLREDLIGDGSMLKHGILNELTDKLTRLATQQQETPATVMKLIHEQRTNQEAQEWSTVKKWVYTMSSAAMGAILAALIVLLITHH